MEFCLEYSDPGLKSAGSASNQATGHDPALVQINLLGSIHRENDPGFQAGPIGWKF